MAPEAAGKLDAHRQSVVASAGMRPTEPGARLHLVKRATDDLSATIFEDKASMIIERQMALPHSAAEEPTGRAEVIRKIKTYAHG
jgi:hypothetical protein